MSSMSSFVAKGNSHNIASGSGLTRSVSMTPEQFHRLRTAPGAPRKPRGYDQMPPNMQNMFPEYQRSVGRTLLSPSGPGATPNTMTPDTNMSGTTLRRTFSAIPGQGIGGFLPPPNGSIQGLNRISDSTDRSLDEKIQQVEKELKEQFKNHQKRRRRWGRARSPTLGNINESLSPRTDVAVQTLSVMNACDSDGNVSNAQLDQNTIDEGVQTAAKQQSLRELKSLQNSMCGFRYSSEETRDFTNTLVTLQDLIQERSSEWDISVFDYEEQVTLEHGDTIEAMKALLGDAVVGFDLVELYARPAFTVTRFVLIDNGVGSSVRYGKMYHMTWNANPSVKLIVPASTALCVFNRVNDVDSDDAEGAFELTDHHPCQCGTMIPLTAQLCGKTRCLNESDEEPEDEKENKGLNRSFAPEPPLVMPKVGDIWVRKARDGPQYAWVEHQKTSRTLLHEYMKQGHRAKVVHVFPDEMWPKMYFQSLDGGICTPDMHQAGGYYGDYYASVEDFYKHMELVTEEPDVQKPTSSVEQKSGGSMSEQQSRSRLASLDALKRAQANAPDNNDLPINEKKRKVVENPEEDMEEEASTPPPKKRGRGRPKGSKNKKKSDVPFAGVVSNQTEYFKMHDERMQQEAILTSIQRANGAKRGAVTRKRRLTTTDGTSTRHAVVGEINDQGVLSPVNSPSNLCRSLSWDTGDSLSEI